jgi:hypothetical protein
MNLSDVFSEVAVKRLTRVDIPRRGSNQHEINGTAPLRQFFKTTEKIKGPIRWHYFSDVQEIIDDDGQFTFYDSRLKSADVTGRSEWRGYYTGDFLSIADPNDILVLAKTRQGNLHGLIFQSGSNWLRSAAILLRLPEFSEGYQVLTDSELQHSELALTEQLILEELGLTVPLLPQQNDEDLMLATFGRVIPDTRTMAKFARSQIEVDTNDSDATLILWLERETQLFYAIEKVLVQDQLKNHFESVQEFLKYSISIQQRRKSRRGYSFQHHLEALFLVNELKFDTQAITEGKHRPDFLFPGESEYHNNSFDAKRLLMLGAKSTIKERWRQILTEADRITTKHLCTLEPGISVDQTTEMTAQRVQLIIPAQMLETFAPSQREIIWSLSQFIEFVKGRSCN